jgi:hypothetical protein
MNRDFGIALAVIAFGTALAVHCPRAALREFRAGIARDIRIDHHRIDRPVRFWASIVATFAAGAMGIFFVIFGVVMMLAYSSDL